MEKYNVIVFSGSMKFFDQMIRIARKFSANGKIVLLPFKIPSERLNITDEELKMLKNIHRQRMDMADSMFVVDIEGYIGNETKDEIEYAKNIGLEIDYYSDYNR